MTEHQCQTSGQTETTYRFCFCGESIRFDGIGWDSNRRQARYLGDDGHQHAPVGCGSAECAAWGGCDLDWDKS